MHPPLCASVELPFVWVNPRKTAAQQTHNRVGRTYTHTHVIIYVYLYIQG